MNKYLKEKTKKNKGKAIALAILSAILAVLLLVVWKLESGSLEQIPETEVPQIQQTEAPEVIERPATEAPETEPEQTEAEVFIETEPEVNAPEAGSITYAEYLALDPEVQQAYYNKFETPDDFFLWLSFAKAEYDAATEPLPTIGNGGEAEAPGSAEGDRAEADVPPETESGLIIEGEDVEDWE